MDSEKEWLKLKVVMFPWLAHGHISPFLELAKSLSERNFHCYIISTPVNLSSIKNKIPKKYSLSIQLVELHLPTSPQLLPPHYHTTNGLPINLQPTLRKALKTAKSGFSDLVRTLRPGLLIHDILQPWAGLVASQHNIPSVPFFTSGATAFSYFYHLGVHPGDDFPFPAIQFDKFELAVILGYMERYNNEEKEVDDEAFAGLKDGIMLVNSSREMEGKYMDYLSKMLGKKIVAVGGLIQDDHHANTSNDDGGHDSDLEIMEWLGAKGKLSTVFVAFGSEYFLRKEEIEEVASGLELSGVNFIWVLRFPKGGGGEAAEVLRAEEALPEGFLERVGERGRIVEKWASQAKILRHSSVGGFVSHCGWNSLKESIDCGVPIIAVPMHLDQPLNAKLVVEMGVGVEVKRHDDDDKAGRQLIKREGISRVIKDVVLGGNGEELRRKVWELRERIRLRSIYEVEEVARKLTKICQEFNLYHHSKE